MKKVLLPSIETINYVDGCVRVFAAEWYIDEKRSDVV